MSNPNETRPTGCAVCRRVPCECPDMFETPETCDCGHDTHSPFRCDAVDSDGVLCDCSAEFEDGEQLEEDLAEALSNSPFLVEMPEGVNRG